MKVKIVSLFSVMALALALFLSVATTAAPKAAGAATAPAATAQPNAQPNAAPEVHPEIREAIASLRRAKQRMEHASHDFGGHRVEAIKATDEAIRGMAAFPGTTKVLMR